MAKKCVPIVHSKNLILNDLIIDNKTGFVISNEKELIATLTKLLNNKKILEKIGKAAYIHVKTKFTWDKVAGRILKDVKMH